MPTPVFISSNFLSSNTVSPRTARARDLSSASLLLHHRWDVFLVEVAYLLHAVSEREEGGNDRTGARTEDQVEALVEGALNHALDLAEHSERVKALRPAAVEAQYPADAILAQIAVGHVSPRCHNQYGIPEPADNRKRATLFSRQFRGMSGLFTGFLDNSLRATTAVPVVGVCRKAFAFL